MFSIAFLSSALVAVASLTQAQAQVQSQRYCATIAAAESSGIPLLTHPPTHSLTHPFFHH
jgi:hypothetical protein